MLIATTAGNLGKDAQHRTLQDGTDICSFSVAADVGYGDNKRTIWVDVAKFGKGAQGLARVLKKGSRVTVMGELTTREHEGKTYLNVRADQVKIQLIPDSGQGGGGQSQQGSQAGSGGSNYDDLDSPIPF